MSAVAGKRAAPGTVGGMLPSVGWLLACSLWLLPVVFGFGMTSWIGFALIGVLVVRIRWVLLAVAWLVVLSWLDIQPDSLGLFLEALSHGYVDAGLAAPLFALYLVGVAYGVHANRVWLRILHERRVRGVRMLGWVPDAKPATHAPAAPAAPVTPAAPAAPVRDERAELLTRVAGDIRAYVSREEQRLLALLALAAAEESAPQAPLSTTPLPTTQLPTTTLSSMTLLGLPSGPVDVRTASVEEIAAIPAVGLERATRLVAARETHPLTSIDEVVELLGLTALDLVRARPYLKL